MTTIPSPATLSPRDRATRPATGIGQRTGTGQVDRSAWPIAFLNTLAPGYLSGAVLDKETSHGHSH